MRATSPFDRVVKKELKLPNWLEPIAEIPKKKDVLTNMALFGALGLIPIFNAQLASTSITVGFAMSLFKLFNRGAPEAQAGSDEEMMELSMRPHKERILLLLCCCFCAAVAAAALALSSPQPRRADSAGQTSRSVGRDHFHGGVHRRGHLARDLRNHRHSAGAASYQG